MVQTKRRLYTLYFCAEEIGTEKKVNLPIIKLSIGEMDLFTSMYEDATQLFDCIPNHIRHFCIKNFKNGKVKIGYKYQEEELYLNKVLFKRDEDIVLCSKEEIIYCVKDITISNKDLLYINENQKIKNKYNALLLLYNLLVESNYNPANKKSCEAIIDEELEKSAGYINNKEARFNVFCTNEYVLTRIIEENLSFENSNNSKLKRDIAIIIKEGLNNRITLQKNAMFPRKCHDSYLPEQELKDLIIKSFVEFIEGYKTEKDFLFFPLSSEDEMLVKAINTWIFAKESDKERIIKEIFNTFNKESIDKYIVFYEDDEDIYIGNSIIRKKHE